MSIKRVISGVLATAMVISLMPALTVNADETNDYNYVVFAGSNDDSLDFGDSNVTINGNIHTNGILETNGNININGNCSAVEGITNGGSFNVRNQIEDPENEETIIISEKIKDKYFSDDCDIYDTSYTIDDTNININDSVFAEEDIDFTGNISLNGSVGSNDDITLNGGTLNSNNSVIFSEDGDITINNSNASVNGLIYAPNGKVTIDGQNFQMNGAIIADEIYINSINVNINYSNSIAEFIGTKSEDEENPDDEADFELFVYGYFDDEAETVELEWQSTEENGSFDVFFSTDGMEFELIAEMIIENTYSYDAEDKTEDLYFKIVQYLDGKSAESNIVYMEYDDDGYSMSLEDEDDDGLPDIYENELGTDPLNPDTDDDGLTDYQEVYFTGTDPLLDDTDGNGISDADEDSDEDGLTNFDEISLGTDPLNADTDSDTLNDGEEINTYETDPLKSDTDEDGISDGDEIKIALDPLSSSTYGVPDNEYIIDQTISSDNEALADINTEDNPYELSIDIKASGNAQSSLTVKESGYSDTIKNDAILGACTELSYDNDCKIDDVVLKFNIDDEYISNSENTYAAGNPEFEGIKRYNIFKYFDDINMLLPVETKVDIENNQLYTDVDELGTYCVMDMEKWLTGLGVETEENSVSQELTKQEILTQNESTENEYLTFSKSIDTLTTYLGTNENNTNTQINKSLNEKVELKKHEYAVFDESMTWTEAKQYCEDIGGHLVTINNQEEQDFINNILTQGTKNLYWIGATNLTGGWKWITDEAFNYTNWNSGEPNLTNENYIHMYRNSWQNSKLGSWNNTLNYVSGTSFHATFNIGIVCEWEDEKEQKVNAILATGLKKIVLDDELNASNNADTDKDSLTDWNEVDTQSGLITWDNDGNIVLPTFLECVRKKGEALFYVERGLDRYGSILNVLNNVKVLPIVSDPTSVDGDGDNIIDIEDIYPLIVDRTPEEFRKMVFAKIISKDDLKQTNDGFSLCTLPLEVIMEKLGVNSDDSAYYDDWYFYAVSHDDDATYSIFKMREVNDEGPEISHSPGIAVPFISMDMDTLNDYKPLYAAKQTALINELDKISTGNSDSSDPNLTWYFSQTNSVGSYLIGEEYIKKIITESLIDGKLNVNFKPDWEQEYLERIFTFNIIYKIRESNVPDYVYISDSDYPTNYEKTLILKYTTGNPSLNSLAAEIQVHAIASDYAELLKYYNEELQELSDNYSIPTSSALHKLISSIIQEHAIKADMGYGEEWLSSVTNLLYLQDYGYFTSLQEQKHGHK